MPGAATRYLVDTSAYRRRYKNVVAERLSPLLHRGLLSTCHPLDLEAGRATAARDYDREAETRRAALIPMFTPETLWEDALRIQAALADVSQHHGASIVDLLVAAIADFHGLTVLHYDADFDAITAATGITTEWVAPPGTADGPDDEGAES